VLRFVASFKIWIEPFDDKRRDLIRDCPETPPDEPQVKARWSAPPLLRVFALPASDRNDDFA